LIRFKWATIRSYRRFRLDDYSAFFSIGIFGTLGWFLVKTTSAFAVVFFLVNSLTSQEWLAKKLGSYLTESTGVKVVFESAIVPKWGILGRSNDGSDQGGGSEGRGTTKIVFKNVYISRGPVKGELGVLPSQLELELEDEGILSKQEREEVLEKELKWRELVSGWTHFHLSIDTVEVTLSLRRWLDGKGLVRNAAVKGVRGVVGQFLLFSLESSSSADSISPPPLQSVPTSSTIQKHSDARQIVSRTGTSRNLEISTSNRSRSKISSSRSTNPRTLDLSVFPPATPLSRATHVIADTLVVG
jgi:hypothetical protein